MIGKNIREIRKTQKMTLSELAERAGIAKSYLSNIERNINQNPSIQVLERIAAVLHVDIQMLLGNQTEQESHPGDEWLLFIKKLQESGLEKENLDEYKTLIEFIHWQNQKKKNGNGKEGNIKNKVEN